jgi:hypothetical protein
MSLLSDSSKLSPLKKSSLRQTVTGGYQVLAIGL